MHLFSCALTALVLSAGTSVADFTISFDWGDIPRCTSGRPNTVGSPAPIMRGVPAGTTTIQFRLRDLNVPGHNHGGGTVRVGRHGKLPFDVFKYQSPCPRGGAHTHEWTATVKSVNGTLATAKARRKCPE